MGIRDDEINRLIKYAKGLGLKVVRTPHRRNDPEATYDNELLEIVLYDRPSS